uniref:Jacalin-type lectin domain-containing protein n=1 Tax=Leersia perrieri TaxID=77586 RepID=A0A0D9WMD3_9ORYZ
MDITLGSQEFVKGIAGTYTVDILTNLRIITNVTTYEFGHIEGFSFSLPLESGSGVVGFYGSAGNLVNSLGVYAHI